MKIFLFALLFVTGCGTTLRDSQVSDPDFVESNDGTMLSFVKDSSGKGYCMFQKKIGGSPKLITHTGGISEGQIKQSLRYMGLPDHLISSSLSSIMTIYHIGEFAKEHLMEAHEYLTRKQAVVDLIIVVGLPVAFYHLLKVSYRAFEGWREGERGVAILVAALGTGVITGPVVELIRRQHRLDTAISDSRALDFSDKKRKKVVQRISAMETEFPGSCDHLKTT